METDTQRLDNWKLPFFTVWSGQAFSLIGSRLAQFALVWWLTESTGSATVLATATLVAILPNVLIGPFAGVLIDRWERRKVMIAADSFVAVVSLLLALCFWSGRIQVWHIFAAMLARATGEVLHLNAMQASTSLMVPNEHLARVAGVNQTMRGALNVAAPPLGALLMSLLPLHFIMGIDVVTALIAVSPLFFIPIPQPQPAAGDVDSGASILQQMRSGFRYVWAWPGLKAVLVVIMLINFIVDPAFSLMPLLVTEHFKGDAIQLGWLESAWGIGMMLGGIGLGIWGGFRRQVFYLVLGDDRRRAGDFLLWPGARQPLCLGRRRPAGHGNHQPIYQWAVFSPLYRAPSNRRCKAGSLPWSAVWRQR